MILPLAIPETYTYNAPAQFINQLGIGKRVEVQFGKSKIYSGLIDSIHNNVPDYPVKPIIAVIDELPIVNEKQLKLWKWMAQYYMSPYGNLMKAALPAGFKLSSETIFIFNPATIDQWDELSDNAYLIAEALEKNHELTLDDTRAILDKKSVHKEVQELIEARVAIVKEKLRRKYKPKRVRIVRLQEDYKKEEKLAETFDHLSKIPKQERLLMLIVQKHMNDQLVVAAELMKQASVSSSVLNSLEKKGIIKVEYQEVSRLRTFGKEVNDIKKLSEAQVKALSDIEIIWEQKEICLLHGVTGSGKTEIYIHLIHNHLKSGSQVLYLLPEIALSTQIIQRLQLVFGSQVGVYHSRNNRNEQVEVWNKLLNGEYKVILGPRSAMFLPFNNLGLVIVDEEHDGSYKQYDPSPRYQCRDSAIMLAAIHESKVLLGSATPSIESYYNAQRGKYGLVELNERFGGIKMPSIEVVDLLEAERKKKMKSIFSETLLNSIEHYLGRREQIILFQNRRGYAPFLLCPKCNHVPQCKNCDVSLTYHQYNNSLKCHVCGSKYKMMHQCEACNHKPLLVKGFGTEKIEDELKIFFPDAVIGRMDYDSIKGKHGYERILDDFGSGLIDILVGTQMVTKGLDFNNVGLAAVLDADQLFHFPEYRANERAYQLLTQVSGRSGRKFRQGKVMIQTSNAHHRVVGWVKQKKYMDFYKTELAQRKKFDFPPYQRLLIIELKHKDHVRLNKAAMTLYQSLRELMGNKIVGPSEPLLSRVRGKYVRQLLIRFHNRSFSSRKVKIHFAVEAFKGSTAGKGIQVQLNVDP